jgi:hypothetical protein
MRIISVAGATSKAGKTLLAEQLIRYCVERVAPVYAVKFTTTSDLPSPCPRGAPCTVCDLSGNFRIVRDPETILQPGKNTQRFAVAANPEHVLWVIAKKSYLPVAYEHLLTHIPENAVMVVEGSTVTTLCRPDLLFYVLANHISSARWKDSAREIMERADFIIVNKKKQIPDHPDVKVVQSALNLDLSENFATSVPEIRVRINQLIEGSSGGVQSKSNDDNSEAR